MKLSRFTFNMFGVNTYILWDEESHEAIIVDPGMTNDKERQQIDEFISNNNLTLTHLVNTHMHIDHSFGVAYITSKYGLKLECNDLDQFLAQRLTQQAEMFGLPISIDDLKIGVSLSEDDTLYVGKEPIKIIHVPGHSPGSIVLYAPQSSFIIAGDVLFKNSIGRTDLPGGSFQQLVSAIQQKLLTLDEHTWVYPGHGPETTIRSEKRNNPYI